MTFNLFILEKIDLKFEGLRFRPLNLVHVMKIPIWFFISNSEAKFEFSIFFILTESFYRPKSYIHILIHVEK